MSKELLQQVFSNIPDNNYTWTLYFYRIDRRANNPYKMHKVRFKQPQYLVDYSNHLLSTVLSLQINQVSEVQNYDGMNTKVSCDKIDLNSELIIDQWRHFNSAVTNASDDEIKGKINGYVVVGQPTINAEHPPLIMVKSANPIIELTNKKSIAYKNTENDELDLITDTIYRLYLTADFLICREYLYAFNHNFEKIFDIEKTLSKVKEQATLKIIETDCVSDAAEFQRFVSQYKSPRTFITLNEGRVEKATQRAGRENISSILKIPLDDNGQLVISDMEKASLLIKYLCYKIFQEMDTEDVLEASTITRVQLA